MLQAVKLQIILLLLGAILPLSAWAKTLRVPLEFPTIQSAVNAALTGDEVSVAPGTYRENITLRLGVSLVGTEALKTIITGQAGIVSAPVITGADQCRIEGLTITKAPSGARAAIYISAGDAAQIRRNIIKENSVMGILIEGANTKPIVELNQIFHNLQSGIVIRDASGSIKENEIYANSGAGITCVDTNSLIEGNHLYENKEAGISVAHASAVPRQTIRTGVTSINPLAQRGIPQAPGSIPENNPGLAPAEPTIRNNRLENNIGPGIICEKASPLIEGNTMSGGNKPLVLLFASDAVIRNNTMSSAGTPVIHINSGGSPIIEGNNISGTRRFSILGESPTATIRNNNIAKEWMPQMQGTP